MRSQQWLIYIQYLMLKYLFFALLAITLTQSQTSSLNTLFLSPAIPPTAYQGQPYEVKFRVRGLDAPAFSYSNLPSFLSGNADGGVSGTPSSVGSFKFTVSYSQGSSSGSSDVVVRVTSSASSPSSSPSSSDVTSLVINTLYSGSYVFRVQENINLQLGANNGKAPYTWSYQSLPAGLRGDNSGRIAGSIGNEGSYTFSASCSDTQGSSALNYYTINVQPTTSITVSKLIDVPNRNAPLVYNATQVLNQQIAANNAVFAALKVVTEKNATVQAQKINYAKAQICLENATAAEAKAEADLAAAQSASNGLQDAVNKALSILNFAKNNLALAQTVLNNANDNVATAQKNLADAQAAFDAATAAFKRASDALDAANVALTNAKNALIAAQKAQKDAQNAYNIAFGNVQGAKTNLSLALNKGEGAAKLVVDAKNAVELANQANDAAQTGFNNADAAVADTTHKLKDANDAAAHLLELVNAAKTELGTAKFNLQQALNQLYVAQSAKEAADKATALAEAQGGLALTQQTTGNSTFILPFAGCSASTYPSITGTDTVASIDVKTGVATLGSGKTLQTGACTTGDKIKVGVKVYYSGHLVNGCIQAATVQQQ